MKVVMTRTEDKTVTLAERVRIAHQAGAGLFISLHANGFHDPSARGYDTHIHTNPYATTVSIADMLHQVISKHFVNYDSRNRGIKRNNFYVLRETDIPALLCENGFMTNSEDIRLLRNRDFVDELAILYRVTIKEIMERLGTDTICLDPGHGGVNSGAVNQEFGMLEKEVVLDLALRIKAALEYVPEEENPIYRVFIDGEQTHALRNRTGILHQVNKHLGTAKEIRLEKI